MNSWVVSLHGVVGWGAEHPMFTGKEYGSVDAIRGLNPIDTSINDIIMAMRWADGYQVESYAR